MSSPNSAQYSLKTLAMLAAFLVAASGLTLFLLARRTPVASQKVTTTITPKPTPVASPSVAPVATKTALTNAPVYVRSGKGTNSPILGMLDAGTTVNLGADSDVNWQEISYKNLRGYVFKAYLTY